MGYNWPILQQGFYYEESWNPLLSQVLIIKRYIVHIYEFWIFKNCMPDQNDKSIFKKILARMKDPKINKKILHKFARLAIWANNFYS